MPKLEKMTFMATLNATNAWRPKLRGKYVVYLRKSEKPYSRLDVWAQERAVAAFVKNAPAREVGVFVEIEPLVSGSRPALEQAIAACKTQNAVLVFGKLDRMRRAVAWLERIHGENVRVMAADVPHFCRDEFWKLYNQRHSWQLNMGSSVRAGLAKAKERGAILGGLRGDPANLKKGPAKSARTRKRQAKLRDIATMELVQDLQTRGLTTLTQIAERLNQLGHEAPRGGSWSPTQIRRVIKRAAE